jgi:hypothetical protein
MQFRYVRLGRERNRKKFVCTYNYTVGLDSFSDLAGDFEGTREKKTPFRVGKKFDTKGFLERWSTSQFRVSTKSKRSTLSTFSAHLSVSARLSLRVAVRCMIDEDGFHKSPTKKKTNQKVIRDIDKIWNCDGVKLPLHPFYCHRASQRDKIIHENLINKTGILHLSRPFWEQI